MAATATKAGEDGKVKAIGALGAVLGLVAALGAALAADNPFLPAQDKAPLEAAIARETPDFVPPPGVTGISVPHHLLAADLIARGFWAASGGEYDRIILISPDHFRKVTKPFGTTASDLDTVFGTVRSDRAGVAALAQDPLVEMLPGVAHEHGLMAVAPFIAHFFPEAEVIPVLGSIHAGPEDWRAMAAALAPLVTARTLIVQSTDYSHYRPLAEAVARDQETLSLIAAETPAGVDALLQPGHMDSRAAQYLQLALQRGLGAHPVILANRNSVEYGTGPDSTTSYIVTAFLRDPAAATAFTYADQTRVMFGGDVLLGRYFLGALRNPAAWGVLRDTVLALTRGLPLIVNFEGVLLERKVVGVDFGAHLMTTDDAAPLLAALKVAAASLANNHANDFGPEGRAESARLLQRLGITPLEHGRLADLGAFRLLALNFVGGKLVGKAIARPDDLDFVCGLAAAPPLVAFVHWGDEYVTAPGAKERDIAERLARCGVSLIVGAHPHQASGGPEPLRGGAAQMMFSLGNFIFDQSAPRGSGALLELRLFKQGTLAARLVPIPNLFDLTR